MVQAFMYHPPSIHEKERFTVLPYKLTTFTSFWVLFGGSNGTQISCIARPKAGGLCVDSSNQMVNFLGGNGGSQIDGKQPLPSISAEENCEEKKGSVSEAEKSSAKVIFGHLIFKLRTSNLEDTGWKDPVFRVFQWKGLGLGQICVVFGI